MLLYIINDCTILIYFSTCWLILLFIVNNSINTVCSILLFDILTITFLHRHRWFSFVVNGTFFCVILLDICTGSSFDLIVTKVESDFCAENEILILFSSLGKPNESRRKKSNESKGGADKEPQHVVLADDFNEDDDGGKGMAAYKCKIIITCFELPPVSTLYSS